MCCIVYMVGNSRSGQQVKKRACLVLVDVHPLLRNDLDALYKRDVTAKQVVLRFFKALLESGYRHFIVDLEQPSDLWVLA